MDTFQNSLCQNINKKRYAAKDEFKVCLIASLYCAEKYIDSFLKNITSLKHFYKCELIIVDADSPEEEFKTIKKFQSQFKNIRYLRIDSRISIYEAWNIGIANSKSEFISNVNLDDLRLRRYLTSLINALDKQTDVDVVFGNFYYALKENFPTNLTKRANLKSNLSLLTTHGLLDFNSPHSAPMWRRNLHKEVGLFDESYKSAGDWEFWLRCASSDKKFGQLKDAISIYYQNPNGISTSANSPDFEEQKFIRRKYKNLLEDPDLVIGRWIS